MDKQEIKIKNYTTQAFSLPNELLSRLRDVTTKRNRYGEFSRFIQDAIEEKLNRMDADQQLTERLGKAS